MKAVAETGRTLRQNSLIKARHAFSLTREPSLADDSGLFIDVLRGTPGAFSSRYAPGDRRRIRKILDRLDGARNRRAQFRACFTYYYAPGKYRTFAGICRGRIAVRPQGRSGFGYDPIFIPRGYRDTFSALGAKIKNRISHRARALSRVKKYLLANRG